MKREAFYNKISDLEKGIFNFYTKHRGALVIENAKTILEIGSGWGIFTRSVLEGNKSVIVHTIDKIPEPKGFAEHTAGFEDRIRRYVGDSKDLLKKFDDSSFDVVFVDGDHGYEGFKRDFLEAWRIVKSGGYIICDDVIHQYHFVPDKGYGIIRGLAELIRPLNFRLEVFPVAHGIGLVKVNK